jgi:hypothetical protein
VVVASVENSFSHHHTFETDEWFLITGIALVQYGIPS